MRTKRKISLILALTLILSPMLVTPVAADFTPNPQTSYANTFVDLCEGETWFINEIERLLNAQQMTLDTINDETAFEYIRAIGLDDAGITGKIPAAIGELSNLEYLFLGGNNLSGDIPSSLFSLNKLQNIDLGGNNYSGAIPAGFGTMTALTHLNLKDNNYTGSIPSSILGNSKIEVLNLLNNNLSGQIPTLSGMTALTYLNLSSNAWGGVMPDLSSNTKLIVLSLWDCGLTGTIHSSVYGLTNLQILDLAENGLTGEISADIGNLTKMQYLTFCNNKLEGKIPQEFDQLTNLEKLNLADNYLRDIIPDVFVSTVLDEINLENNYLRGTLPQTLVDRYDAGASVYLMNNYLTGSDLANMPNNEKNFADGATSEQYQLTSTYLSLQVFEDKTVDIYNSLRNRSYANGNTTQKVLLNSGEYDFLYDPALLDVEVTATGINVKALAELPKTDNVILTLFIMANDGSDYSTIIISLTTDTPSVPAPSGGGGMEPVGGDETTETHTLYVNGYPDGTFQPNGSVTREEIAKMLITALNLDEKRPGISSYTDVLKERWSFGAIEAATERGYLQGYGDGIFAPGTSMTRAELATVLVRIAERSGRNLSDETIEFTDVLETVWYAEYVEKAASYGLVNGYEDGTFRPNATVTRAEAVTMINRVLNRNPETAAYLKTAECPFSDVPEGHWAYLHVLEAALTHEH